MRKVLLIGLLVVAFTLLLSATALANSGPHLGGVPGIQTDGGFPQETDACAGCHRAHTGTAAKLLKTGATQYAFCTSCHDGTGANANVNGGIWEGGIDPSTGSSYATTVTSWNSQLDGEFGKGLNAGGFVQAAAYTDRLGRTGFANVTSTHTVEGLGTADGSGTAWGGGTTGLGSSGSEGTGTATGGGVFTSTAPLKCGSCHDPHGSKNSNNSERYRLLLNKVTRYSGQTTPEDISGTAITADENTLTFPQKDYTATRYVSGTSTFCAACHTQYTNTSSTYNANDGNSGVTRYRHPVYYPGAAGTPPAGTLSRGDATTGNGNTIADNVNAHTKLPVEQSAYGAITADDKMVCLTCHQAHGTGATMTDNAVVGPAGTATNRSTLLRLNNRGVCQDCHQR